MKSLHRTIYACATTALLLTFGLAWLQDSNAERAASSVARVPLVKGIIVQLRPEQATSSQLERPAAQRMRALSADLSMDVDAMRDLGNGHHAMTFSRPQTAHAIAQQLARLRAHPDVLFAEPDELLYRKATPNDADYALKQWYLQSSSTNAGATNVNTAWNTVTGSSSVVVAVLDTGIRAHPDLAGRTLPGYDFVTNDIMSGVSFANDGDGRDADPTDPGDWISQAESLAISPTGLALCDVASSSWHGTYIAGIIGAASNNGAGIAGINWSSKILPVRVAGKCGAYSSNIIDGMRWAAGLTVSGIPNNPNPAKIINLSFGGSGVCSAAYQAAINEVTAAGSLVVVAAGNESGVVGKPANCANAMAVGAARHDGLKTSYSNYGAEIALIAPGGAKLTDTYPSSPIWSTSNSGTQGPIADIFSEKAGTSFSAPVVAGVASLMLSANPALMPAELIKRMRATSRPHTNLASVANNTGGTSAVSSCATYAGTCNCTTATCGAGLLDAAAAVVSAQSIAANIVGIYAPAVNTAVTLDGRSSGGAGVSANAYLWTQTAGPAVSIPSPTGALNTVQLPSEAGTFTFKLQVTNSLGGTGTSEMTFTSVAPVASTATASSSKGGALSLGWGLGLLGLLLASSGGAISSRSRTLRRWGRWVS